MGAKRGCFRLRPEFGNPEMRLEADHGAAGDKDKAAHIFTAAPTLFPFIPRPG